MLRSSSSALGVMDAWGRTPSPLAAAVLEGALPQITSVSGK